MDAPVFALPAEFCIAAAASTHAALREAMAALPPAGALSVDGAAVETCDTAGLQLLLSARRELQARGGALVLGTPSAALRDAMARCGIDFGQQGRA